VAKPKPKLSPKEIAEIGLQAIKAREEENRQIGKEARAMTEQKEAARRGERARAAAAERAPVRHEVVDDTVHELYRIAHTLESLSPLSNIAVSGGVDEDDYEATMVMARDLAAYAQQKVRKTADALDRAGFKTAESA